MSPPSFFPPLMERIRDRKFKVSIAMRAINELHIGEELDLGTLHLAIGIFGDAPPRFVVEPLAPVEYVWVMRRDHPAAAAPFGLETLTRFPHLDIRLAERPNEQDIVRHAITGNTARLEALLAEHGLTRRVGAVTGHLLAVPPLIAQSDMLARIPERLARQFAARYGLVYFPPPYPMEPMTLGMIYHRTLGAHPAAIWLRGQLHELGASFPPPEGAC